MAACEDARVGRERNAHAATLRISPNGTGASAGGQNAGRSVHRRS